jgi:cation diffusion facilitator family transporter
VGADTTHDETVAREKKRVALASVGAAIFLTGFKAVVGLVTGSLGILAEALHSGLDLAAAAMTYAAVRIADRPPDDTHPYGHGKVESFSALFETGLLVITCGWIVYEAVERLFFRSVEVIPSLWGFVVMFTSIGVDWGRSRALMRAATRYRSQALEADALHFSTDIWSSSVVIVGLALVKLGDIIGHRDVLMRADAVAALGVALIVIWVSYELGRTTVDVLLDRAPHGVARRIAEEAIRVPGVVACRRIRVRQVGPTLFVDMVVEVARATPLEQAHAIVSEVESRVRLLQPQSDIVVHFEPVALAAQGWAEQIQAIAGEQGLVVHEVRVGEQAGRRTVTFHLEVDPHLSLADAHAIADALEASIRRQVEGAGDVVAHIEPRASHCLVHDEARDQLQRVLAPMREIAAEMPALREFHDLSVRRIEERLFVTMHCVFDPQLTIGEAHRLSSQIEGRLKSALPEAEDVHIHVEPPEAPARPPA